MSRVDRNLSSMPVPEFAFPDRHDGRVFGVLGMSIDYRVKVPNSPAGGKS